MFLHAGLDPALTWLQKCAMSGLHAWRTARAPGRICAIAADVESSKTAPIVTTFFFDIVYPRSTGGKLP
jgi:hypothetical protein